MVTVKRDALNNTLKKITFAIITASLLSGCGTTNKPLNEGVKGATVPESSYPNPNFGKGLATGTVAGTTAGTAAASLSLAAPLYGAGLGAFVGATAVAGYEQEQMRQKLLMDLRAEGVNIINLGDMVQIVIPADDIFFPDEAAEIKDTGKEVLHDVVLYIKEFGPVQLHVESHTDDVGSVAHRVKLSNLQSQSVATYLWAHGISRKRIDFNGYASTQDVATNNSVSGSAYNRRIEINFRKLPPTSTALRGVVPAAS
tara:strand:+ start:36115 stop:36882 length:768 start_codon:yes stop_codon:yes gene_type:complete